MSAPAITGSEYRAFMIFDTLPTGCISFPVTDDRGAPHLRIGEFAVVDTDDREPRSGEVYLIQWQGGRRALVSIKWLRMPDVEGWWIGAPANPWQRKSETTTEALKSIQQYGLVEGPIAETQHLKDKLVGRVVGILGVNAEGPMAAIRDNGGRA